MKIKTKRIQYEKLIQIKRPKHFNPKKPNIFFRTLVRFLSQFDMWATKFSYTKTNMERRETVLILY